MVPTIIIGVGGVGSKVVDKIYSKLPTAAKKDVVVEIFDTNINDISQLEYLDKNNITQTSKAMTVRQFLLVEQKNNADTRWFPTSEQLLLDRSLTEGAGQVRAISRLALRAAMNEGKLDQLKSKLTHLFRVKGDSFIASPRVVIVSSIAGGTGAGIFIQTAMYMRELLQREFNRSNTLITGAFLLPDIIASTDAGKTLSVQQKENIRANAYACIKELNAITKYTSQNTDIQSDLIQIELEYKPNQIDNQGRPTAKISRENLPYNFSFLYDFENSANENLGFIDNYINQVVKSIYLNILSPLAGNLYSKQDNEILELIGNKGLSRYCGSGTSELIYPYEDLVNYCAKKWAINNISNEWLNIDNQFQKVYANYEKQTGKGQSPIEPKRGQHYIETFTALGKSSPMKPFWANTYKNAFVLDQNNEITKKKKDLFLAAVDKTIGRYLENNPNLAPFSDANLQIDELKHKDDIRAEVERFESILRNYRRKVEDCLETGRTYLIDQIMPADEADWMTKEVVSLQDYEISAWVLNRSKVINPLTLRFMLYELEEAISKTLAELKVNNQSLADSMEGYRDIYDDPKTEDKKETVADRLAEVEEKTTFFNKKKLKRFAEEYLMNATAQLNTLNSFKFDKLKEMVLGDLLQRIQILSKELEVFFSDLRSVQTKLQIEVNELATKHNKSNDFTVRYVLASNDKKDYYSSQDGNEIIGFKQKIWEEIKSNYVSQALPESIGLSMYKGIYKRFVQKMDNVHRSDSTDISFKIFTHSVVEDCRKKMFDEPKLNLNCIDALRKEAMLRNIDDEKIDDYIKTRINELEILAKPFVPNKTSTSEFNSWGLHPECSNAISESFEREIFSGNECVKNESFSKYEIVRCKTLYGLTIDDFPKFDCGDENNQVPMGSYYRDYQARIKTIMTKSSVTPHLDTRWHLPIFLEELSDRKTQADRKNVSRALLLGLFYGYLEITTLDGAKIWQYRTSDNKVKVIFLGEKKVGQYIHQLHKALLQDPYIVSGILEDSKEVLNDEKLENLDKIDKYSFYRNIFEFKIGQRNLLDFILSYSLGDPSDSSLKEKASELLGYFVEMLHEQIGTIIGKNPNTIKREVQKIIDLLRKDSILYKEYEKEKAKSELFLDWKHLLN